MGVETRQGCHKSLQCPCVKGKTASPVMSACLGLQLKGWISTFTHFFSQCPYAVSNLHN